MDIWVRQFDVRRAKEWLAAGNDDAVFQLVIAPEQIFGPGKYILGGLFGVISTSAASCPQDWNLVSSSLMQE
jgi:hypothetical protein